MSNYEFGEPYPRFEDEQEKLARDQEAEHLEAKAEVEAERLWEHRPARPDPKPLPRVKRGQARYSPEMAVRWRESIFDRDQGCYFANPAECEPPFEVHHVVYEQQLRRDRRIAEMWDTRIGMCVCRKHHQQHHHRIRVILREEVPAEVRAFVYELGYGDWFQRCYPAREDVAAA